MERKKNASGRSRTRGNGRRRRKPLNFKRLRVNIILAAAIFGISAGIFAIRFGIGGLATEESRPGTEAPGPETRPSPAPDAMRAPEAPETDRVEPGAASPGETAGNPVSGPASPSGTQPVESPRPAPSKPVTTDARVSGAIPEKPATTGRHPSGTERQPVRVAPSRPVTPSVPAAPPPERPTPVRHRGTLVFVFDDAGHNLKQLEPFLRLPFPCTIAVLPGLEYSGEAARRVRAAGKEAILHQPMQAINRSKDPGPGAITEGMSPDRIKATVRKNLAEVWPVAGINNHEGSLITADDEAMRAVLSVAREKGIYFLDSRTNAKTLAPAIAREMKMTIWERAVFLDNAQDRASIEEAVTGGLKLAEKKGAAIMIGHIWSADLADVLSEMYPELVSQGYSLSTIARIATDKDMDE